MGIIEFVRILLFMHSLARLLTLFAVDATLENVGIYGKFQVWVLGFLYSKVATVAVSLLLFFFPVSTVFHKCNIGS